MSFKFKDYDNDILFVPLGGSNEIGMNLNLYRYKGKWIMVDLGIGFADDYLPGIEVIVPDMSFVEEHKDDIVALIITHAHEDHLGAVPYLWRELHCPIYATPFTAAVLKQKLASEGLKVDKPIVEVGVGSHFNVGPFELEMVCITHSIPEMQAVAIRTDKGTVLHTGDWKLDPDPLVGPLTDEDRLKHLGDEGVLAMICDSTNVFVEGESGSESDVREGLINLIKECSGRIAVTTFASNIARIESIIWAGMEAGRKIVLAGRSLQRIVEAAKESGYLKDSVEFLSDKEGMDLPREEVLIICTGSQGEPLAALTKIARGEHPNIRLVPGDSVIFASRKIPGNEMRISWVHNQLVLKGVEVVVDKEHTVHVSGHPARFELARMYQWVRPKIAVPVHGEPRHLHEHVKFARSLQVPEAVEASNGAVILLSPGEAKVVGQVKSGYMAIDGTSLIPTDSPVIKTRRKLRDDGAVFVCVVVDEDGALAADPAISMPGVVDPKEDEEFIDACVEEIADAVERLKRGQSDEKIREAARLAMRKLLKAEIGKKPVIEVQIVRV